jgi:hypothetical protein
MLETVIIRVKKKLELDNSWITALENDKFTKHQKEMLDEYESWRDVKTWYKSRNLHEDRLDALEKDKYDEFNLCHDYANAISEYITDHKVNEERGDVNYFKGYGFYVETDYLNIFRNHSFPEDVLHSAEEAYKFYMNNVCFAYDEDYEKEYQSGVNPKIDELTKKRLEEFYNKFGVPCLIYFL